MFDIQHAGIYPNLILKALRTLNKRKCIFHYAAMPMMTSQILRSVDFTKTQKFRYLENEKLFYLQIKKSINYKSRATSFQKLVL